MRTWSPQLLSPRPFGLDPACERVVALRPDSFHLLNAAHLAGPIDTTEKPTEVPRQPHKQHCDRFDRQPVFW